jgi:hypothetical protein
MGAWHFVLVYRRVTQRRKLAKGRHICYNTRRCPDKLGKDLITQPMKNQKIIRQIQREVKAVVKLIPLIVVSLLLVAFFWRADLAATSGLFQSPPTSEPASPAPEVSPTDITPEAPTAEVPTATTEPTATLPPTETATLPPPTATETPVPTSFVATATFTPTPDDNQRYADEDSNVKFEFGALFDSVALAASYIWLCCGLFLLFLFPLLFVALWVASVRRRKREE